MKRRNLYLSLALMCGFFTIAFTFNSEGIHWLWQDQVPTAIVLGVIALVMASLWIRTKNVRT
jgi:hypothetical protein